MTIMTPVPDYHAARVAMVDTQLRPQGVNDPELLAAYARVPREQFVPEEWRAVSYIDRAIPLGDGRMLPPPAAVGLLLTQLAPERGERALVIGAGSGYSATLLSEMGLAVVAVESAPSLAARAREMGVTVVEGPLEEGARNHAPFDLVLIDGAVEVIPDTILEQLKEGGRLGCALIDRGVTRLIVGRKAGGSFGSYSIEDNAMPPLPGFRRPQTFTF